MARLHCDDKIRPAYVTEVCRLLKASNINIVKDDIELEENQNALNQLAEERRDEDNVQQPQKSQGIVNDLFVSHILINNLLAIRSRETSKLAQANVVGSSCGQWTELAVQKSQNNLWRVLETCNDDNSNRETVRGGNRDGLDRLSRYCESIGE